MLFTQHQFARLRPVSVRCTLDGEQQETVTASVRCPTSGVTVPVSHCAVCPHSCGLSGSARDRNIGVFCTAPEPAAAGLVTIPPVVDLNNEVRSLMTRVVYCVTHHVSIQDLVRTFSATGASGFPVTRDDGTLVGFVSKTDLMNEAKSNSREEFHNSTKLVEDIMMPMAFVIRDDATVLHAASLMAAEDVHHLAVVDEAQRVVGYLSTLDIVRWLSSR